MASFYQRELSIFSQFTRFRQAFPDFKCFIRKHSCLVAEGDFAPTAFSETYRVRIEYPADGKPKVWVLSPKLVPREPGGQIPHMFLQERLCLNLPGEWSADQYVAESIVPWVSEWLYYYELWHATGEWLGGGHEPGDKDTIRYGRTTRGKRKR